MTPSQRGFAESVAALAYCNPFLPERIEHERAALGDEFIESGADWNVHAKLGDDHPNVQKLARDSDALATELADKLARGAAAGDADRRLYEDLALFVLYHRFRADFEALMSFDEGGDDASFFLDDDFAAGLEFGDGAKVFDDDVVNEEFLVASRA